MSLSMAGWQSLEPKVRKLWLAQAAIGGVFSAVVFMGLDFALHKVLDDELPVPPFVLGGLLALVTLVTSLFFSARKYDYWKYRLGEDDLAVGYGILWRTRRFISRARIQHVDITAGVIARALGLVEMTVFVGGQLNAAATIPGLTPAEAERLRGVLLGTPPANAFSEAEEAASTPPPLPPMAAAGPEPHEMPAPPPLDLPPQERE